VLTPANRDPYSSARENTDRLLVFHQVYGTRPNGFEIQPFVEFTLRLSDGTPINPPVSNDNNPLVDNPISDVLGYSAARTCYGRVTTPG
jgi:hypothetical protein